MRWTDYLLIVSLLAPSCSASPENAASSTEKAASCERRGPEALRRCVASLSESTQACYANEGRACGAGHAGTEAPISELKLELRESCPDGLGPLSAAAVETRLSEACTAHADSLAWRTYGGPHGALWPDSTAQEQSCLKTAHLAGAAFLSESLSLVNACLGDEGACDPSALRAERDALAAASAEALSAQCSELDKAIAVGPSAYFARAAEQADCLTAVAHLDTGGVDLSCGPANADFEGKRGEFVQVRVDGDKWGTRCGDGSDYAFLVRLAPEGHPLDRVVIGLQGGGVCLFEEDCAAKLQDSPDLFTALDEEPDGSGITSNDPEESPFANWTKVLLPYCTQDVFAGGGVTETLGELELHRYGAVNLRAAVRMTRDVLWKLMDSETETGFLPSELLALFGGWSAGGYGTLYNYHWLLDDLQWPRTIAYPDAGLALDNGSPLGVKGLGLVKIPQWGTLPHLPPYCFRGDCAVGPVLYEALSPRLKQVPEQQMLILSNPKDSIQQGDAFFDDEALFINTMRESYCATKDLPGINYYFTSVSDESVHVVSLRPELWKDAVDGEAMRDWFLRATEHPETIQSRVEEADFVDAVPGVKPYPCTVAP